MNRSDRLHALHESLRRAGPRGRTAAALAEELEVSARTVKRDVSALQHAGAPIWAQPGPGGGYVLDGSASLPPVALTPSQAVALSVALAVLPAGSPFALDARTATRRVLDTMAPRARERADELTRRVWVLGAEDESIPPPRVLRAVERSLAEQVALAIGHRSADGTETRRTVEPVALLRHGRWYLVAHCRLRDDLRWFRMDRITRATPTTERYEPRPVADIGEPPETAGPVTL